MKNVRLAIGVLDIEDGSRFQVLPSNCSKFPRLLPKGPVLPYAVQNPIEIITPERKLSAQCGDVSNIMTVSARR